MGVCRRVREPRLIVSSNLEQVWDTAAALNRTAEPSLQSLERQLATRPEPLRAVQRLQGLLQTLLGYTDSAQMRGQRVQPGTESV